VTYIQHFILDFIIGSLPDLILRSSDRLEWFSSKRCRFHTTIAAFITRMFSPPLLIKEEPFGRIPPSPGESRAPVYRV
jgi:hypothetical protein